MIVIRFHLTLWGFMWAPAEACCILGWRRAFQFGPVSVIRKDKGAA